jgi:SAM-dependent methyltransferase
LHPTAHVSGLGQVIETGPTGETEVDGLYAAGNVTDPSQQVLAAAANGSHAGAMISFSLAAEDLGSDSRPAPTEADWDHRYQGNAVWSGNPNGALVAEVADLPPGRALDVGAGEGADAIWLAETGWTVTANDVSRFALERTGSAARQRGVEVDLLHADANGREPFEAGRFDLVTAHYASIPRTPDNRGAENLLAAVAPGGTLLVVGHDPEPMRRPAQGPMDPASPSQAFDPDAFVRHEDLVRLLSERPEWQIERHELRPRPAGVASHHTDDLVLRARRA